ncbi:hypothetical protein [Sporosarcina sp. 6E9]|uniref:hypothetical protein n=1 Tax=Sporosarcina sp. 6E9 TaxID=2819235 RepID=UPI001B31472A|nr:hypothetical protein [Sporosarcina sp. 6E9]
MKIFIFKKEEGMGIALIVSMIFVVIVLAIGVILTISAANSMNKNYSSEKSLSNMLWIYVLSIPFIVIVTLIAIFIFY